VPRSSPNQTPSEADPPDGEQAAETDDRRRALAAALVLTTMVLAAGAFLSHGMHRYALTQDCAMPGKVACDTLAEK
jgi:hypothetical protein